MKAPKKIYLAESDRYKGEVTSTFASSYPIGGGGNIEYIRKDALLEWLKAKRAPFMGDNDYGKGNIDALDEVINKLNEI